MSEISVSNERPLSAAPDLDLLWADLWNDLDHNGTGYSVVARHRAAIEDAARATAQAEVARLPGRWCPHGWTYCDQCERAALASTPAER